MAEEGLEEETAEVTEVVEVVQVREEEITVLKEAKGLEDLIPTRMAKKLKGLLDRLVSGKMDSVHQHVQVLERLLEPDIRRTAMAVSEVCHLQRLLDIPVPGEVASMGHHIQVHRHRPGIIIQKVGRAAVAVCSLILDQMQEVQLLVLLFNFLYHEH